MYIKTLVSSINIWVNTIHSEKEDALELNSGRTEKK